MFKTECGSDTMDEGCAGPRAGSAPSTMWAFA
jgi:hypothetical protein